MEGERKRLLSNCLRMERHDLCSLCEPGPMQNSCSAAGESGRGTCIHTSPDQPCPTTEGEFSVLYLLYHQDHLICTPLEMKGKTLTSITVIPVHIHCNRYYKASHSHSLFLRVRILVLITAIAKDRLPYDAHVWLSSTLFALKEYALSQTSSVSQALLVAEIPFKCLTRTIDQSRTLNMKSQKSKRTV